MALVPSFSDFLTASVRGWCNRNLDEALLSLAIPMEGVDPLNKLSILSEREEFSFLWDTSPGLCLAASGKCQHLDLVGARRFELSQRFSDASLARLLDLSPEAPTVARPKLLFAFTFFDQPTEKRKSLFHPSPVQAVLPRWQLVRQGRQSWLRINGVASHEADAREHAEQLWLMRERLIKSSHIQGLVSPRAFRGVYEPNEWQESYIPALSRGIELVNERILQKLVLAVRQSIVLKAPIDPLAILLRLRKQQAGSCRFLWRQSSNNAFFGASPERLLSLRKGQLRTDALAGTASGDDDGTNLLRSDKDRREHELVVNSITQSLVRTGLEPRRPREPRLARHGRLVHLHSPITASSKGLSALNLADKLHPTPAVAGLPCREAMSWLRTLEPFDRGGYAGPIGWIDNHGDAEFRVAIRCGSIFREHLELTAGAGLVKGSIEEKELQEVSLKLAVLADQFDLRSESLFNSSPRTAIT